MRNGSAVAAFEAAFADYVGAKYCIGLINGTATIHTALLALGVKPGDRVAVPPLTMSATAIAVLQAGAIPVFCDVDPRTWLIDPISVVHHTHDLATPYGVPVSLYGLHWWGSSPYVVDDAAQTLRPHGGAAFTSYSFQASKILALGEGGMLATNDQGLAEAARSISSLGYQMRADQPRIDPAVLKRPDYARHHRWPCANYRMNDLTAAKALNWFDCSQSPAAQWDEMKWERRHCARLYAQAVAGCPWIESQHVPEGWTHDYWSFTVALATPHLWEPFTESIVRHGGEMPYGAWRLTYREPAFAYLAEQAGYHVVEQIGALPIVVSDGSPPLCPVAEDLQPRLVQFQTNHLAAAERNADAVAKAIKEIGG